MSRRVRLLLPAPFVLALGALGLLAPSASAYWSGNGAGSGSAFISTLGVPVLSATVEGETVKLAWSAAATPEGAAGVLYYVKRNGASPAGGCPSETAPAAVLTCTDSGLAPGGTYTYTVVARWRSWQSESAPAQVSMPGAQPAYLQLEAARSAIEAGESDALTITVRDSAGAIVTSYSGPRTLTFSGASAAPNGAAPTVSNAAGVPVKLGEATTIDFSSGRAIVSGGANGLLTLFTAETTHLVARAGALSNESAPLAIEVGAGTFAAFGLTPQPAEPQAGVPFALKVRALDSYGNLVSGYVRSGALTFSGAEPSPAPAAVAPRYSTEVTPTFTGGEALLGGFALYRAGTTTLRVSEAGSTHSGAGSFTVAPGAPASLSLQAPLGTVKVGEGQPLTITALDAYDNVATTYGGANGESKSLTFTGARSAPNGTAPTVSSEAGSAVAFGSPVALRFLAGKATVTAGANGLLTLYAVETAHIVASAGSLSNAAAPLALKVLPGAPRTLALSAPTPAAVQAGKPFAVTITALDAGGNIATELGGSAGQTQSVAFSGPEASPSGTAPLYPASATSVTFKEGVGTATGITLYRAGATTLAAKIGEAAGALSFTVAPGPAKRLAWSEPQVSAGTIEAGCALKCTVNGLGSLGRFTAHVAISDEWGNPQSAHEEALLVQLGARRLRGFGFGGYLDRYFLTIPAGQATSPEAFTFTAPYLFNFGGRHRRPDTYSYEVRASAAGIAARDSARAHLHS
jgi:hypothetical protein